jgi:hypothetical protein
MFEGLCSWVESKMEITDKGSVEYSAKVPRLEAAANGDRSRSGGDAEMHSDKLGTIRRRSYGGKVLARFGSRPYQFSSHKDRDASCAKYQTNYL